MLEDVASGKTRKSSAGNWLLWWRVSPAELQRQVADYRKIRFGTARILSAILLTASAAMTGLFVLFGTLGAGALVDTVIFVVLALFVALGHRWAMIGAMIVWTVEKAVLVISPNLRGIHSFPIVQVLWWCVYLHAFYLAFRVEQERRKPVDTVADVFS
jgi:hypothetical protein